ncbi:hypothetical protein MTR_3g044803 [Medicago truncatula]|uniref:Uncharacterized protein n=1 Tax=Medicago truncatula TaxID=3880 RepID=A0A072UVS5_MEDTR|nr:hypothetical protein MTR_3g044803 [Medicago truncatula]
MAWLVNDLSPSFLNSLYGHDRLGLPNFRSKSLGEFIPEIERYLHKKKREAQNNIAMAECTLKEYATPSTEEPQAIIVYPTVEGNNFEIKPALLNLVQQIQFSGSPTEDPNLHISSFSSLSLFLKG